MFLLTVRYSGLSNGQKATGQQKSSEELTTAYLTKLYEHLMYTLDQTLGASILRTIPIEFCLSVPAIWSEVAKEKTLKAFQTVGINSNSEILLVSEPVSNCVILKQRQS